MQDWKLTKAQDPDELLLQVCFHANNSFPYNRHDDFQSRYKETPNNSSNISMYNGPSYSKGWVKNNTKTRAYCFRNKQRHKLQYITPKNTQSNLYGLNATSNLQKNSPMVVYVSYHFLSILIVNWLQMQMLRDIKITSSTSNMMASFKLIAKIRKELQNVFKILQG